MKKMFYSKEKQIKLIHDMISNGVKVGDRIVY